MTRDLGGDDERLRQLYGATCMARATVPTASLGSVDRVREAPTQGRTAQMATRYRLVQGDINSFTTHLEKAADEGWALHTVDLQAGGLMTALVHREDEIEPEASQLETL